MPDDHGTSPEELRMEVQRTEELLAESEATIQQLREAVDRLTDMLDRWDPPPAKG